jgi:hypothetical protein
LIFPIEASRTFAASKKKHAQMDKRLVLVGLGVAAIAGLGVFKGLSLSETASNIRVSLASLPKIHKIDFTGIKVSVDLRVDNPSKERITVKIPSVRLLYKGKLIASTAISNKAYTIEAVSTSKIPGIIVEAGYLSLIGTGILTDANRMNSIGFEAMIEINGLPIKIQKI